MLAAYCKSNEETSNCAKFIGSAKPNNNGVLLSHDTPLLSSDSNDAGLDVCSFLSDPSDAAIIAFCESSECAGAIAFSGGSETSGSFASSGGSESCGSVA